MYKIINEHFGNLNHQQNHKMAHKTNVNYLLIQVIHLFLKF